MEVHACNLGTLVWRQEGLGIEVRLGLEVRKATERSMPGKTRKKSPSPPAARQQRLQEAGLS